MNIQKKGRKILLGMTEAEAKEIVKAWLEVMQANKSYRAGKYLEHANMSLADIELRFTTEMEKLNSVLDKFLIGRISTDAEKEIGKYMKLNHSTVPEELDDIYNPEDAE
jgi:hypothetical protein